MEYLIVALKDAQGNEVDRGVVIDGQSSGGTNQTLMVQEGHHEIRLDDPTGFTPALQDVLVQHTADDAPMIVTFTPA